MLKDWECYTNRNCWGKLRRTKKRNIKREIAKLLVGDWKADVNERSSIRLKAFCWVRREAEIDEVPSHTWLKHPNGKQIWASNSKTWAGVEERLARNRKSCAAALLETSSGLKEDQHEGRILVSTKQRIKKTGEIDQQIKCWSSVRECWWKQCVLVKFWVRSGCVKTSACDFEIPCFVSKNRQPLS